MIKLKERCSVVNRSCSTLAASSSHLPNPARSLRRHSGRCFSKSVIGLSFSKLKKNLMIVRVNCINSFNKAVKKKVNIEGADQIRRDNLMMKSSCSTTMTAKFDTLIFYWGLSLRSTENILVCCNLRCWDMFFCNRRCWYLFLSFYNRF